MRIRSDTVWACFLLSLALASIACLDGVVHHRRWSFLFYKLGPYKDILWICIFMSAFSLLMSIIGLCFRKKKHQFEIALLGICALFSAVLPIYIGSVLGTRAYHKYRDREYLLTMKRIHSWAHLWEKYYSEKSTYLPSGKAGEKFAWGNITASDLMGMFHSLHETHYEPTELSPKDGWEWDLQFCVFGMGKDTQYGIRSPGKDGKWEGDYYWIWPTDSWDYDRDIVFANGQFVQWEVGGSAVRGPAPIPTPADWSRMSAFPDLKTNEK